MRIVEDIKKLFLSELDIDGYCRIVQKLSLCLNKKNLSKEILSESNFEFSYWSKEDVKSIFSDFVIWLIEKGKFKFFEKINDDYLEYYFLAVFHSYCSEKINISQQKRIGFSFSRFKKIMIEILEDNYNVIFLKSVKVISSKETNFDSKKMNKYHLNFDVVKSFSFESQLKPQIKKIIDVLIEQNKFIILNEFFFKSLFDQIINIHKRTYQKIDGIEIINENYEIESIRKEEIVLKTKLLLSHLVKDDFIILRNIIFEDGAALSFKELSTKFSIPKSTIHYKYFSFKKSVKNLIIPFDNEERFFFLEVLKYLMSTENNDETLDKIRN